MLLGRVEECALLDELLDAARSGFGGSLVVVGDPGLGKTSLLEHAAGSAAGMTVLRARGCETELDLAFSALADLVGGLSDEFGRLPPDQAAVLAGALAIGPPREASLFAVLVAAHALVVATARERPLLLVIDDGQWLDTPSRRAVLYLARRAHLEPVAVLIAVRDDDRAEVIRSMGLRELRLDGLGRGDADELLNRVAPELTVEVRGRLIAETEGNPLALIEIPPLLDDGQRAGTRPLPDPLPSGRSIERAYQRRVQELRADVQTMLLLIAASETHDLAEVMAAADELGVDPADLGPAEQAGLVVVSGREVVFRHPLVRSAVYHSADPPSRRAAHRAMAASVQGPFAEDRQAWHAAAGADGPDEAIAIMLEQVALRVRYRGGRWAATETFQRAAELTPDPERRAGRLHQAALEALRAGRYEVGERSADAGIAITQRPLTRADLRLVRGRSMLWRAPTSETLRYLVEAADDVQQVDPARAAVLLAEAANVTLTGDVRVAIELARRAHAIGQQVGPPLEHLTGYRLGYALLIKGEESTARPLLQQWLDHLHAPGALVVPIDVTYAALAYTWLDEYELSRRLHDGTVLQARAMNAFGLLPFALAGRAELNFRTGDWSAAEEDANESITLGLEFAQGTLLAFCWIPLIELDAARGNRNECLERAISVFEAEAPPAKVYGEAVLGVLHLGVGELDAAIAHLEASERRLAEFGVAEIATTMALPNLIEAYARAGRTEQAWAELARLEETAERTQRTWTRACAARCRGLLTPTGFQRHFRQALELHSSLPNAFDQARTELCFAERLRRAGERTEARQWLRSALTVFKKLDARCWVNRAEVELRATGERVAARKAPPGSELTAQELQIARLVAAGATNREVAAALFLSTKTVERHLSAAYRKAGVRSRTQLARVVHQQIASAL